MINYSQGSSSYASHGNLCSQAQRFILFAEAHQAEASRRTHVIIENQRNFFKRTYDNITIIIIAKAYSLLINSFITLSALTSSLFFLYLLPYNNSLNLIFLSLRIYRFIIYLIKVPIYSIRIFLIK